MGIAQHLGANEIAADYFLLLPLEYFSMAAVPLTFCLFIGSLFRSPWFDLASSVLVSVGGLTVSRFAFDLTDDPCALFSCLPCLYLRRDCYSAHPLGSREYRW